MIFEGWLKEVNYRLLATWLYKSWLPYFLNNSEGQQLGNWSTTTQVCADIWIVWYPGLHGDVTRMFPTVISATKWVTSCVAASCAFRQVHRIIYPDWLWQKCKGAPCTLRRFANAAPVHFFWAKLALGNFVVENPVDAHQAHGFQILGMFFFQVVVLTISERTFGLFENGKYPQFICILKGLMMIYRWTDCGFPSIYRHSESPLQNGTQHQVEFPAHHHRPQVPPGICISWVFLAGVFHGVFQTLPLAPRWMHQQGSCH